MTENLPTQQTKVANIRALLERSKSQMAMALPKHLTADRLLRVAMTSIQKTPSLMDCTPQSLLACVMTCAQLGLEPDQFLGQAYLVPFRDNKKGVTTCTLIPGYRGYISLARRSGEMQTVSAQVVYSNDDFKLQYGINDILQHSPRMSGDRGEPIGAYCVFKYKDGGYSFDFLPTSEIEKVRKRSKAATDGPWVTDWDEMAKKTVIKRHAKLAPLSVEFQRAIALEDRANAGEDQSDLLEMDTESYVIDITGSTKDILKAFDDSISKNVDMELLNTFLARTAEQNKVTVDAVKADAAKDQKNLLNFWKFYQAWVKQQKARKAEQKESSPAPNTVEEKEMAPGPCPGRDNGTIMTKGYCNDHCTTREGCPIWEGGRN